MTSFSRTIYRVDEDIFMVVTQQLKKLNWSYLPGNKYNQDYMR